ncbi:MAG: hypothetical protein JXB38_13720 [Anaerolineales bacterium]|nr:hypothetical protein [Anaerolineales bacterium]
MPVFQHKLWGYALTYPDGWVHQTLGDAEGFAVIPEGLQQDYEGPQSGHLLVRAEWNCARQPIEPKWKAHIGRIASFIGAKKVGAAPWAISGGQGFEAELVLPKKNLLRLWAGILEYDFTVLHLMVSHPKDEREWFEPLATQIVSSLQFLNAVDGVEMNAAGIPLPPAYTAVDPTTVLDDIADPENWTAYTGGNGVDALQAFYLREAPNFGWQIAEYVPFPSPTELGFARLRLVKDTQTAILGLMPMGEEQVQPNSPARIVVKYT